MPDNSSRSANVDLKVVEGFGAEWSKFDHRYANHAEYQQIFDSYFEIFPWNALPGNAVGFDLGCGSGRWAALVAPRVGHLYCIDPSEAALRVARDRLASCSNCSFQTATAQEIGIPDGSADFGYSLGVLHHVPSTELALAACIRKLKPGAPFLLYLYYAFDNRPRWFHALWRISDMFRWVISRLPFGLKSLLCELVAFTVYWPLARAAKLFECWGVPVDNFPLSSYRDRSLYVMRTDALDRFGTPLERRFTRAEMLKLMTAAGLEQVQFSNRVFWCALGRKRK